MVFGEKIVFEIAFSRWQFLLLAAICVALVLPDKLGSETATLTTYYAAPVSSYDSLRVRTYAAIGTTSASSGAAQGSVKVSGSSYMAVGNYLGVASTTLGLRISTATAMGGNSELMLNVNSTVANNSANTYATSDSYGRLALVPANGAVTFNAPIASLCKWVRYDSVHGQGVSGEMPCSTVASQKYAAIAVGAGTPPNVKVTFKADSISKNGAYMLCCRMTFFQPS